MNLTSLHEFPQYLLTNKDIIIKQKCIRNLFSKLRNLDEPEWTQGFKEEQRFRA